MKKTLLFLATTGFFVYTLDHGGAVKSTTPHAVNKLKGDPQISYTHDKRDSFNNNFTIEFDGFTVKDKEKIAQILNLIPNKKPAIKHIEKDYKMIPLNIKYSRNDVECMAKIVYHEARGEIWAGQQYIMDSVITRVLSDHFPNSVCSVASQKGAISAYGKPYKWRVKPPSKYFAMAEDFLSGKYGKLPYEYATAFWEGVNNLKQNKWAYRNIKAGNYSFKVQIGNQIFWQHKDVL